MNNEIKELSTDFTDALLQEYWPKDEHRFSFNSENGYRGVGCKNLSQEVIDEIINTDRTNLIISGNSIVAMIAEKLKKEDQLRADHPNWWPGEKSQYKFAKLTCSGQQLWDYLYYRGGTKEHPGQMIRTILDFPQNRAIKFWTETINIENTIAIKQMQKPYKGQLEVQIVYHNKHNEKVMFTIWIPDTFYTII